MSIEARNIVGANTKGNKHDNDLYSTPPEVTEALLDFLEKHSLLSRKQTIWECACGNGAMTDVMAARGYKIVATDIALGHDFIKSDIDLLPEHDAAMIGSGIQGKYNPVSVDWIITNPPFNRSEDFIRRGLELNVPFAFLLKSQYWHSSRRLALFREHPPQFVLPLTWRPDFTGQGSSLMDMMWCVWLPDPVITETIYIPLGRKKVRWTEKNNVV